MLYFDQPDQKWYRIMSMVSLNLYVTVPFFISHSDFSNYIQVSFNQHSFKYLINYLEFLKKFSLQNRSIWMTMQLYRYRPQPSLTEP